MKRETLERANNIARMIEDIKNHSERLVRYKKEGVDEIMIIAGRSNITLAENFLPSSINDLVSLYIARCEAKIKELEKELEDLKD